MAVDAVHEYPLTIEQHQTVANLNGAQSHPLGNGFPGGTQAQGVEIGRFRRPQQGRIHPQDGLGILNALAQQGFSLRVIQLQLHFLRHTHPVPPAVDFSGGVPA